MATEAKGFAMNDTSEKQLRDIVALPFLALAPRV